MMPTHRLPRLLRQASSNRIFGVHRVEDYPADSAYAESRASSMIVATRR
jgi:hypothetical protein